MKLFPPFPLFFQIAFHILHWLFLADQILAGIGFQHQQISVFQDKFPVKQDQIQELISLY